MSMNRREFLGLGVMGTAIAAGATVKPKHGLPLGLLVANVNGYKRQWWREAIFYEVYTRSFRIRMETASATFKVLLKGWTTSRTWASTSFGFLPIMTRQTQTMAMTFEITARL